MALHAQRLDKDRARFEAQFVQPRRLVSARAIQC
jgi:hypothetical protein